MSDPSIHAPPTQRMLAVIRAAHQAHEFLHRQAGRNADWPIAIKVDNQDTADALCLKLSALAGALKEFHEHCPELRAEVFA